MNKTDKDFQKLPFTTLAGSTLSNFNKIVQGRRVEAQYRKRFVLSKLVSAALSPFTLWEKVRWQRRVAAYEMPEAPIFIIGHWRSGTTLLHNLLAQDKQFAYCTTFQGVFPNLLLTQQWWFKPIFAKLMPAERPSDGVKLGPDLPQEEDFGLGNTIPNTIYNAFYFPMDFKEYLQQNISRASESRSDQEQFLKGYRSFAAKAMMNPIFRRKKVRRLLSKNPPHTARIDQLLQLYPNARFIYLQRDPFDAIASFKKFAKSILNGLQFHDLDESCYEDALVELYSTLRQKYLTLKSGIPQGQLVELDYDELLQKPMQVAERLYQDLGIGGFQAAKPSMEAFVHKQRKHQAAGYDHPKEFILKVERMLQEYA